MHRLNVVQDFGPTPIEVLNNHFDGYRRADKIKLLSTAINSTILLEQQEVDPIDREMYERISNWYHNRMMELIGQN